MEKDVFDDINLEESKPDPWWRKPLIYIIGVFLLILVISLSFSDALHGIIQSKSIFQNKLEFENATILFENNTLKQLQNEFVSNENREIKACLYGSQEDSTYVISSVEFPEVIHANVVHIASVPCPINTLIDLHSHPINQCLASEQDIRVYNSAKQNNPQLRMMVMCSSKRFALI